MTEVDISITSRDAFTIAEALATAILVLKSLSDEHRPDDDIADMKAMLDKLDKAQPKMRDIVTADARRRFPRNVLRPAHTKGKQTTMTALIGKYFIGFHDGGLRSGIVEAAIDVTHYLVRFDDFIGFTDGSKWPPSLAVVPIGVMTLDCMHEQDPPPWLFFDDQEQRARYEDWSNEPPTDRTPRLVTLSKSKKGGE
jgi:hypothetical protein